MKKNQKMMISAATLAVLASSVLGACSTSQSQSPAQIATEPKDDVETWATSPTESTVAPSASSGISGGTAYADGTYTGGASPTRWGDVQVAVVIKNGAIADVEFLTFPDGDYRSAEINSQATVALVQEAIQSQSADVQVVSGATFTSLAFMESLNSALAQAA